MTSVGHPVPDAGECFVLFFAQAGLGFDMQTDDVNKIQLPIG